MKKPLVRLTSLALVACLANAPTAYAATATDTFNVTANIPTSCSVTAGNDLAFGDYTGTQIDATTTVSVTCTSGGAYTVGLNDGTHFSSPNRRMLHGTTDFLNYELYKEDTHTNRWGNSGGELVSGTGTGSAQTLTVYGRLPGSQSLIAGAYTDTITVTVTYTP
ncbi:MAG TPA: spore coat U domain-containing protein [Gallionella sp.]|nr:spore coat U domain-containing protein [Gallionella sp.]